MADHAAAFVDLIDSLRLNRWTCSATRPARWAVELALARPEQVRRVVLIGVPVFDAREREAFNARPWPAKAREDGSHLVEEWQRVRRSRGAGAVLERLGEDLGAALRAGDAATWLPAAAANYAGGRALAAAAPAGAGAAGAGTSSGT